MTIYCKLCKYKITSKLALDPAKAEADCLEALSKHLVTTHQAAALELKSEFNQLTLLIATYLLVKGYATIPPESGSLQAHFEEMEHILIGMFSNPIQVS